MEILTLLIVGLIGGLFFYKLKFPAGFMVGSMIFCAIYGLTIGANPLPQETRIITQLAAGAFIGHSINKKDLLILKGIIKPAILMMFSMVILNLLMGFLMSLLTGLDMPTTLMASAPGGMMDISILSHDVGADSAKVALLQLLRLMTVIAFFPLIIRNTARKNNDVTKNTDETTINANGIDLNIDKSTELNSIEKKVELKEEKKIEKNSLKNLFFTLLIGTIFGLVGKYLKVPAGPMTFSLFGTALFNIVTNKGYMNPLIRRGTQVLAGILIGSRMTYNDVISIQKIIIPAFVLIVGIILINFLVGFLLHKVTGLDMVTSQLSATPGGLSDIVLMSGELGADKNTVAVLQLFRYILVIVIFPLIIKQIVI